jgi:hypothetical protein
MVQIGRFLALAGVSFLVAAACSESSAPAVTPEAGTGSAGGGGSAAATFDASSPANDVAGTATVDKLPIDDTIHEACEFEMVQMSFIDECGWNIPASSIPTRAENATVTMVSAAGPQKVIRVSDVAACSESTGWYYADPTLPRRVELCDETCRAINAAAQGSVITFAAGCP